MTDPEARRNWGHTDRWGASPIGCLLPVILAALLLVAMVGASLL